MAEGGWEFDNPEFDKEEYDEEAETSFADEEQFHRVIDNQYSGLKDLTGEAKETQQKKLTKSLIKRFYEANKETIRPGAEDSFYIDEDKKGRPVLYLLTDYLYGDDFSDASLSYYRNGLKFYSYETLQRKYGIDFVRKDLGIDEFKPKQKTVIQ